MTTLEKLTPIIVDQLGVHDFQVRPEARFVEDFGADSLDAVELAMEFEDHFQVDIDEEDMDGFKTVGDVVRYIDSKISARDNV